MFVTRTLRVVPLVHRGSCAIDNDAYHSVLRMRGGPVAKRLT